MTKVYCDLTTCKYIEKAGENDFVCSLNEIELSSEECCEYASYVILSPEYRETFWKRIKSRADGHICRQECNHGKRYERDGNVYFTQQDDRWGIDDIWFTEEKTGLRLKGKDLGQRIGEINGKILTVKPVMSFPEAQKEDVWMNEYDQ